MWPATVELSVPPLRKHAGVPLPSARLHGLAQQAAELGLQCVERRRALGPELRTLVGRHRHRALARQGVVARGQALHAAEDGARRRHHVEEHVVEDGLRVDLAGAQGVGTLGERHAVAVTAPAQRLLREAVHGKKGAAVGQLHRRGEGTVRGCRGGGRPLLRERRAPGLRCGGCEGGAQEQFFCLVGHLGVRGCRQRARATRSGAKRVVSPAPPPLHQPPACAAVADCARRALSSPRQRAIRARAAPRRPWPPTRGPRGSAWWWGWPARRRGRRRATGPARRTRRGGASGSRGGCRPGSR